ncbi:MAG: hypothetical protein UFG06_00525 [Lachnospiraceae bacterium]|nr:hypothetical protein [Lachnospiraceae bacterium]
MGRKERRMALGAIELATIARSQDFTTIKHGEDYKGAAQQTNLVQNMQRETEQKTRQVTERDAADWQKKKFDARDKGNDSYNGDGGSKRKKKQEPDGKVFVKGRESFDIKI